jgi:hypothetical protein
MGSFREWPRLLNTEKNFIVSDASFAWSASDEDAVRASESSRAEVERADEPSLLRHHHAGSSRDTD